MSSFVRIRVRVRVKVVIETLVRAGAGVYMGGGMGHALVRAGAGLSQT